MNDMTKVIAPKSDQLNSDDLISGPRTITIREVDIRPGTEQPVSIFFNGDEGKPWKTCKSMNRVLVQAWGPDAKAYVGRSVTIYRDPDVTWAGMKVGGIRISHMSDIERPFSMALTATKKTKAITQIKVLQAPQQQEQRQPDTDAAANWTKRYIGNVEKCADIGELVKLENSQAVRLAELKEKRPELHKQITDASTARSTALSKEGKPDEDAGEGFTDDAGEGAF